MSLERKHHEEQLRSMADYEIESILQAAEKIEILEKINTLKQRIDRKSHFDIFFSNLENDANIPDIAKQLMRQYFENFLINDVFITLNLDKFFQQLDKFTKLSMTPSQIKNLKDKVYQEILWVEKMEEEATMRSLFNDKSKQSEYLQLVSDLRKYIALDKNLKNNLTELSLHEIYKSEQISNIQELINSNRKNRVEIMVVDFTKLNFDLALVIQMRAKSALKKGNDLIVMDLKDFHDSLDKNDKLTGVTKLSFLHHVKEDFGYVEKINHYIDHLPDLNEIVIRGCGVSIPHTTEPQYSVKISKVPFDKAAPVQGETDLILQQEEKEGKIYTRATWASIDKTNHKRMIKTIDPILNVSKISGRPTEEQLCELEQNKEIPFLKHGNTYINSLRDKFFNIHQTLSPNETQKAKKAFRRARTETLTQPTDDYLSKIWNTMTAEQRKRVSLKGYAGGYQVRKDRIIPEHKHDQMHMPKAGRFGPKR